MYRPCAAAYENYAQYLTSVYKASRAPEDFVRADQEFRKMRRMELCTAEDLRQWGVLHQFMMRGCIQQAETVFDEALAIDPAQCEAQSALGFYYEEQGAYEQAHAVWSAMEQRLQNGGYDVEKRFVRQRAQRCQERMQGKQ